MAEEIDNKMRATGFANFFRSLDMPHQTIAKRLVGVEMVVGTTSKDKSKPQRIAAEVAIYPNDRICTPCL